jgi:osmoprotectant transport system permease protein
MSFWNQFFSYYSQNGAYVWEQFVRHLLVSLYGVIIAIIIAVPLGFLAARYTKFGRVILPVVNAIQTLPQLAVLSVLMLIFGVGTNTVVITVTLYSILPVLKNTYAGIQSVDPDLVDASIAMGMTDNQVRMKVILPLSISVIMAGIRNAAVMAVGIATIGTFIGAGGMGDIITRGIAVTDGGAIILAGVIPVVVLALLLDLGLALIELRTDPFR